jgi:hypothetical protein
MSAQAAGNVRKNYVAVVQLDGKRRARKHLLDASIYFKRGFFSILNRLCLGYARILFTIPVASSDNKPIFWVAQLIDHSKDRAR